MRYFIVLPFLLFIYGFSFSQNVARTSPWFVTRIVDGDTFYARSSDGKEVKFRPIGFDCPETGRRSGRPEPFHQEATRFTTETLLRKVVYLEYDIDSKDQFGRDLVYVFLADGLLFNEEILRAGWAELSTVPPNVKYANILYAAMKEAQQQHRGIWRHLIVNSPEGHGKSLEKVFICNSPGSKSYHRKADCRALKRCKAPVIERSRDEASRVYQLKPCGFCY
jgi:micrococcal nuclease